MKIFTVSEQKQIFFRYLFLNSTTALINIDRGDPMFNLLFGRIEIFWKRRTQIMTERLNYDRKPMVLLNICIKPTLTMFFHVNSKEIK